MRAFCGLVAAVALLSLSGAAVAQTVAVTITKNGYVPKSLTIHTGDTVAFTNGDTVAHQVTFKSTAGVTCTPNPLVLQPAATGNCVFATAGSYSYSDPNTKGNTFRGTITVAVPPDSTRSNPHETVAIVRQWLPGRSGSDAPHGRSPQKNPQRDNEIADLVATLSGRQTANGPGRQLTGPERAAVLMLRSASSTARKSGSCSMTTSCASSRSSCRRSARSRPTRSRS